MLVEVIKDHLGHGIALEDNDQTLTSSARRFIAEVGDSRNFAVFDKVRNLYGQVVWVSLVRQFSHDQTSAPLNLLNTNHSPHGDRAASCAISIFDTFAAQYLSARGEIRTLDALNKCFQKLFAPHFRVGQIPLDSLGHFS